MATIGLNEGPYLIFTITYNKGKITIADSAELRIPTIVLNSQDTVRLSSDFPRLITPSIPEDEIDHRPTVIPITDDVIFINSINPSFAKAKECLTFRNTNDCFILIPESETTDKVDEPADPFMQKVKRITFFAIVHGTEYLLDVSKEVHEGKIRTYLQVCNAKYSVKGFFNEGATDFFEYVLRDLDDTSDHCY